MRLGSAMGITLAAASLVHGVIIDKVAVRVDNAIIKDSDINRNIRVTDLLNQQPLRVDDTARQEAVKRLIDQVFIREEIRVGDYPRASWPEADVQLNQLKKDRFHAPGSFTQTLSRYGLTEADLRFEFQWQLNVLRFIDSRFKPAVLVKDDEVERYYREHTAALKRAHPDGWTLDDLQDDIRDQLAGDKVNDQFFAWLDGKRKNSRIAFYEGGLK